MSDPQTYKLDESHLHTRFRHTPLEQWVPKLIEAVNARADALSHGLLGQWQQAIESLPELPIQRIELDHPSGVAILTKLDILEGSTIEAEEKPTTQDSGDVNSETEDADGLPELKLCEPYSYPLSPEAEQLEPALRVLQPWRKGPYRIGHVHIDTEWRSDWKWNRIAPHISSLENRCVLDVGCGNGYHMWRMRSAGASTVLGIDPSVLFQMQFNALQHYINDPCVSMLPLTMDTLPAPMHIFDTVFSMGVLYHRKDPHAHLKELRSALRSQGELILETLIAPGEDEKELIIDERYARMRNIWTLPSVALLAKWLLDAGFEQIRCVSVDITSQLEQRTTSWMPFESLTESLNPENRALTVEGHPRPRRVVLIATGPKH